MATSKHLALILLALMLIPLISIGGILLMARLLQGPFDLWPHLFAHWFVALLLLGVVVGTTLAAVLAAQRLSRQLRLIAEAAAAVAQGDSPQQATIPAGYPPFLPTLQAIGRIADFQAAVAAALSNTLRNGRPDQLASRSEHDELVRGLNLLLARHHHLSEMTVAIADGDLTNVRHHEQIAGEPEEHLARMVETLEGLVAKARNYTNQILRAGSQIHSIMFQGTLDTKLVTTQIGEISQSIHQMATNIQRMAEHVRDQSERLGDTSTSIEHTIHSMDAIADSLGALKAVIEQTTPSALASERTTFSLDLLAETTQAIEKDAGECVQYTQEAVAHAEHGAAAVQQTSVGIHAIQTAMQEFFAILKRLGERADEVNEILDVMSDIADHTNLLAMNAAIISAHAGDRGRDFAVIADEIGKFVDRTRDSTSEIGELLRTIQTEVAQAGQAMEASAQTIADGVELSHQAGTALKKIGAGVVRTQDIVTRIAAATANQTREHEHIRTVMQELVQAHAKTQAQVNTILAELTHTLAQIRGVTSEQAEGSARLTALARSIDHVIQEIGQSSEQYMITATQIIEAVNYIRKLVHRTTTGAERVAQLTDDLFTQGGNLALTMGEFVIAGRVLPPQWSADRPTIGFLKRGPDNFFNRMALGIRNETERVGFQMIETDAAYEATAQVEDLNWCMKQLNVRGLVICPVDISVAEKLARKCLERGISCVAADESVPNTLCVRSSNREGGQRAAEILIAHLPPRALVGVVVDRTASSMVRRLEGFRRQAEQSAFDLLEIYCDVSEQDQLSRYLAPVIEANPELKGLFLTNELVTAAYITMLHQGLLPASRLLAVGYDDTPLIAEAIRNGELLGAIFQHPEEIGKQALSYLLRLIRKEIRVEDFEERTIYIPTVKVTKETL